MKQSRLLISAALALLVVPAFATNPPPPSGNSASSSVSVSESSSRSHSSSHSNSASSSRATGGNATANGGHATGGRSDATAQGGNATGGQGGGGGAGGAGGSATQSQSAQGGSATNAGNAQTLSVNQVRQLADAPDAIAPNVYPSASCYYGKSGGVSFGNSGFGAGITGGKAYLDEACDIRETARSFASVGNYTAANQLLCSTPAAKKYLKDCGAATPPADPAPTVLVVPAGYSDTEMKEREKRIIEAVSSK